ncbi:hypothetical protein [Mycobacterium sp. 050134]|uniref:hypothetical protein n=1 Tax=Mycobacterium sp. 050134 TaxID=3096111 RepID=UPI002ED8199D
MELAGFTHEHSVRSGVARRANAGCERPAVGPHAVPVRMEPGHPASPADQSQDGAAAADRLQADYFLRLLAQNRRLIDHRIDEYRKAIAAADVKGDAEGAGALRRLALGEERDRQTVDGLIDQLRRRFSRGDGGPVARRAVSAVR